ncbi:hypothetical protein KFE25_004301 [Diacronema lutheri]|uniref:Uncharacterized protein n=1 Tax=Diacronema lutheri TaxID=2081491 RepID=A0A8J5X9C7_DIALT|nr:hypothetical protein KFE25_004301 [Diacronema lutheri]
MLLTRTTRPATSARRAMDARTTRSLSKLLWAWSEADGLAPLCERTRALLPEVGRRLLPRLHPLSDLDFAKLAVSLAAADAPPSARAQTFAELAREARARDGQLRAAGACAARARLRHRARA